MSLAKPFVSALLVGGLLAGTAVALSADEPRRDVVATVASDPVPFHQPKPATAEAQDSHRVAPTTTTTAPPPPPPPTTTTAPRPVTTTTAPPEPVTAPEPTNAGDPYSDASWDQLAECESGGNWSANTGNGYYGGIQFSLNSWQGVGGSGLPSDASRSEQIKRGRMLWEQGGWKHWPSCSSELGWR